MPEFMEVTVKLKVREDMIDEVRLQLEDFIDDFFVDDDVKLLEYTPQSS